MQELQHPWESLLGSDYGRRTFERHAALLGDNRMSQLMHAGQRAMIVQQLQRDYGNRYVQRLVEHISETRGAAVQPKLTVGPAGDKYEREADRVAKQVISMTEPSAQRQEELEEEEMVQAKSDGSAQRQGELEEEELQMKPLVQRQPVEEEEEVVQMQPAQPQIGLKGGDFAPEVEQSIQKARGQGRPLPENVSAPMEIAFGADFSGVRVHTDVGADDLNRAMSARAFTSGQDIFFRQGEYNPVSSAGKEVLAHELTHVVQQSAGPSRTRRAVEKAD